MGLEPVDDQGIAIAAKDTIPPESSLHRMTKIPTIHPGANEWISSLANPGHDAPFVVYPAASALTDRSLHLAIPEGLLRQPLEEYQSRDPYPIPACADREGYHGERHFDWWCSGLVDYLKVCEVAEKHRRPLTGNDRIFEFGCASGRVLRHFSAQNPGFDVWGSDISLRHVEWVRQHLNAGIKIFQNTVLPHLPMADNSCALFCAFSVFSHIDEFEMAWLAEVRRVLQPGGLAYLTIHGENTWKNMKPEWPIHHTLMRLKDQILTYKIDAALFAGPLPRDKTVFRWLSAKNYNTNVFHTNDYIRNAWGRFLEVVEIIPAGHNYQDVVVLRKAP